MPIERSEFEEHEPRTNAELVLSFLVENQDKAYRAAEIQEETVMDPNSIHPVLNRLREQELVMHKPPYWTIGDVERIRDLHQHHRTSSYLDDKLREEDRDDWLRTGENDAG